jgi:protein-S-isoprenylcysteine O-methyltransferase Ste14
VTKALIIIRPLLSTAVLALLVAAAGRHRDSISVAYLGAFASLGVATALAVGKSHLGEQICGSDDGADPGVRLLGSLLFLATVTVAAFDSGRFHWSPTLPGALRVAGLAMLVLFGSLQVWAMAVNPYFSPRLWIQPDHRLVVRGPYRFLRHPGYLAMLVTTPATSIALGSLAGVLPALGYEFLILRRAMREDALLREKLGGYAEYAGTVRCRIAPGLW